MNILDMIVQLQDIADEKGEDTIIEDRDGFPIEELQVIKDEDPSYEPLYSVCLWSEGDEH